MTEGNKKSGTMNHSKRWKSLSLVLICGWFAAIAVLGLILVVFEVKSALSSDGISKNDLGSVLINISLGMLCISMSAAFYAAITRDSRPRRWHILLLIPWALLALIGFILRLWPL